MAPGGARRGQVSTAESVSLQLVPSGTRLVPFSKLAPEPSVPSSMEKACQGQARYKLTHRAVRTPLGRAYSLG